MCRISVSKDDIAQLEWLYDGRKAYFGELHDHAATGGRSDGHCTLDEWKVGMAELNMDFATIVDHKQVRHMYLEEWDDTMFIGGTEAATWLTDRPHLPIRNAEDKLINGLHYNMIFAAPEPLLEMLQSRPEFQFEGDALNGIFPRYPKYTVKEFQALIAEVKERGGFVCNVHPKANGMGNSDDPMDFWFADETGLEVIYTFRSNRDGEVTGRNYKLWTDLLRLGKRIWATAGNDEHRKPSDKALSTIYADCKHAQSFVGRLRVGDLTAGPVGIRMCIGDTVTGGICDFAGKRLVVAVGDFHSSVADPTHTYRVDIFADEALIYSQPVSCKDTSWFATDTSDCHYYRAEVFDTTLNSRIAIGNPIWNEQKTGECKA